MKRVLLDTNAYAAFKRGEQEAIEIIRYVDTIGLSVVVLGELLSGFKAGLKETNNRRELDAFLESSRVTLLTIDEATAGFYAHVYFHLKRKGKPIPTNDLWIAATALQHGFMLFSYDRHFLEVEGLITGQRLMDFLP